MISTLSHNKYRIQALSEYVYICRRLYLHSIIKLVAYSQKRDAQIQQQLSQKYKTNKSDRRCSVSVQNATPAQQGTKEINMKGKIHIINYGL